MFAILLTVWLLTDTSRSDDGDAESVLFVGSVHRDEVAACLVGVTVVVPIVTWTTQILACDLGSHRCTVEAITVTDSNI